MIIITLHSPDVAMPARQRSHPGLQAVPVIEDCGPDRRTGSLLSLSVLVRQFSSESYPASQYQLTSLLPPQHLKMTVRCGDAVMLWCRGAVVWTVVVVVVSKELSEVRYDGQDQGGATTTPASSV